VQARSVDPEPERMLERLSAAPSPLLSTALLRVTRPAADVP
jgi:hypothetical protein